MSDLYVGEHPIDMTPAEARAALGLPQNPPAFPMGNPTHGGYDGMTLRDWFAGQCIHGWEPDSMENARTLARFAYVMADALLAEREKRDA